MNCRFCNAEIGEDAQFCPFCGKENAEPEAGISEEASVVEEISQAATGNKPQKNTWMFVAIAACCALAVLLAFVIWQGVKDKLPAGKETTGTTTQPVVYDTYHGTPEQVLAAADKVVATVGEHQLTNRQLQMFYWSEFYNFVNYQGNYLSYYGLDYTQPLNEQGVPGSDSSWEQYFVDVGLESWHRYLMLGLEAKKNGYEMNAEDKAALEQVPADLEATAKEYGFASADEMIVADMGEGTTVEDYLAYLEMYHIGMQYYGQIYDRQDPTREEVSTYFDENAEVFASNYGVTKDSGKLVDVRHILLQPEGAQVDAATGYVTATEDQWEACRQQAQAILDGWAAGEATEEAFAVLANEHSVDGGSNTNGGLYEGVLPGQMVKAFDAWLYEEGRRAGDTGLVKTEFGYHIMYYVNTGDDAWYTYGRPELINQLTQQELDALLEENPMEIDYDAIVLDSAVLGSQKETGSTEPTGETENTTAE